MPSRHTYASSQPQRRDSSRSRREDAAARLEDEQLLLHQTVMASKRQQIEVQLERLAKQRAFIRHEKRKLLLQNALLESERERFEASLASDWFCTTAFPTARDRLVTIDVGGQLFEISSTLAAKDAGSLLAAFVANDAPLAESECGCFRVDRDWWLFRYVLAFLRDGVLPHDPKLLCELYRESAFWKLATLQRAIEMRNMALLQVPSESDAAATTASLLNIGHSASKGRTVAMPTASRVERAATATKDPSAWWLDPPLWWGSSTTAESAKPDASSALLPPAKKTGSTLASMLKRSQAAAATTAPAPTESAHDAWWSATTYKGVDFAQPLSPVNKTQQTQQRTEPTADDAASGEVTPRTPLVVHSTWSSSHHVSE